MTVYWTNLNSLSQRMPCANYFRLVRVLKLAPKVLRLNLRRGSRKFFRGGGGPTLSKKKTHHKYEKLLICSFPVISAILSFANSMGGPDSPPPHPPLDPRMELGKGLQILTFTPHSWPLSSEGWEIGTAVTWLKYCQYGVKLYQINQPINQSIWNWSQSSWGWD